MPDYRVYCMDGAISAWPTGSKLTPTWRQWPRRASQGRGGALRGLATRRLVANLHTAGHYELDRTSPYAASSAGAVEQLR
jgi:hypothetical protein